MALNGDESVTAAGTLLQQMDRQLKAFPEVERVFGKAGRAETSTDPAPFSMMEVVVDLKPKEQWRPGLTHEALVDEDDPDKLGRVLVPTPTGAQIPLSQLATLRFLSGPSMIRDEDGMLSGYVYVDMTGRDVGGYVEDLKLAVRQHSNSRLPSM